MQVSFFALVPFDSRNVILNSFDLTVFFRTLDEDGDGLWAPADWAVYREAIEVCGLVGANISLDSADRCYSHSMHFSSGAWAILHRVTASQMGR
jgi:hypothetical protein